MCNRQMKEIPVGVVGLGLMGSSIIVSLLASGHRVVGLAPLADEKQRASAHIAALLRHADEANLLKHGIQSCINALKLVEGYEELSECKIVLECVTEDKQIKKAVYRQIAGVVSADAIIASNTSAIPISELQALVPHPERFLGVHWAEPAYMTRFLEITCGRETDSDVAKYVATLGLSWDKEPTVLLKDIRGFITNRLMYAVYREALSLVEQGIINIGDADKACRYDMGSWMTLMGVFRRMDFMGLADYRKAFESLFVCLSNRDDAPIIIKHIAEKNGKGIHNLLGLYEYTTSEAKEWEQAFADFNEKMYFLAPRFSERSLGVVSDVQSV